MPDEAASGWLSAGTGTVVVGVLGAVVAAGVQMWKTWEESRAVAKREARMDEPLKAWEGVSRYKDELVAEVKKALAVAHVELAAAQVALAESRVREASLVARNQTLEYLCRANKVDFPPFPTAPVVDTPTAPAAAVLPAAEMPPAEGKVSS